MLLDEPLSNLDATLRLTMRSEIKRLQRQLSLTTILVTHDQVEATTMADRIVCMNKGRIEQVGTPDDLYLRPASLFVAGFIGAPPMNIIDGRADDGQIRAGSVAFDMTGTASGEVKIGLRPEQIRFAGSGLPGRIDEIEPMGRETLYLVGTDLGALRVLETGTGAQQKIGSNVFLTFNAEDSLLFDLATEGLLEGVRVRPLGGDTVEA